MSFRIELVLAMGAGTQQTLERLADALLAQQRIQHGVTMSALDTLTTEVSESKTVMASAVALIAGLKTRLDEALAAQAAGDNGAALAALAADLDGSTNALAVAVAANTPGVDSPGPAPAPAPAPADPSLPDVGNLGQ